MISQDSSSHVTSENGCKIFIGQIPKDMDENDLRPYLEEFGTISEISIIRERDRDTGAFSSKGCAFATFVFAESAENAVEKLHDKVKLPHSHNPLQVRIAETQIERENKLFVGMLPKTATEQDLTGMFAIFGELREVHIIRGPEGGSKGCAFVKFNHRESAITAIRNLHDSIPMGATRPLVVKFADSKKQNRQLRADEDISMNLPHQFSGLSLQHHQQPIIMGGGDLLYQSAAVGLAGGVVGQSQGQRLLYPYNSQQLPYQVMQAAYPPTYSIIDSKGTPPTGAQNTATFQMQQESGYFLSQPSSQSRTYGFNNQPYGREEHPNLASGNYSNVSSNLSTEDIPRKQKSKSNQQIHQQSHDELEGEQGDIEMENLVSPLSAPLGGGLDRDREVFNEQQEALDSLSQHVRPPEGPAGANLFIYHLPRDIADADLATLFAPFGNVISAKVFVDKKTSDSKGFGFVSYDILDSANSAIEAMNGFQIGSKRLKVQHKRVGQGNSEHGDEIGGPPSGQQTSHYLKERSFRVRGSPFDNNVESTADVRRMENDPNISPGVGSVGYYGGFLNQGLPTRYHSEPKPVSQQPQHYSAYPQYGVDILAMNRRRDAVPQNLGGGPYLLSPPQSHRSNSSVAANLPFQSLPVSMGGYSAYSPSPATTFRVSGSAGYDPRTVGGEGGIFFNGLTPTSFSPSPGPNQDEYIVPQHQNFHRTRREIRSDGYRIREDRHQGVMPHSSGSIQGQPGMANNRDLRRNDEYYQQQYQQDYQQQQQQPGSNQQYPYRNSGSNAGGGKTRNNSSLSVYGDQQI